MRILLLTVLPSLLLAACESTTPNRFAASDFFGEWRLQVPATSCWPPLDIAFAIDPGAIEREGRGSMNFASRWGSPADTVRVRLVSGNISWETPRMSNFAITFFQAGEVLGELVANADGARPDRLEGIFFDPNRQSCRTDAAATKVAG